MKTKYLLRPIISSLLLLFTLATLLTSCGSSRTIVNGLDEKEANEILVFLANRGIEATKVPAASEGGGGKGAALWNIQVNEPQANEAMSLLNQAGLPRRRGQNLLNIFSNVGLVPSGMEQRVRYQAGLAEQIASIIRKIDGVLDADVQISFPEEDPLNPTAVKGKITASVYVKHNGVLDDPNAHLVTRIKRLVAGSITGLDYDNVTVIGDRARVGESPAGYLASAEEEKHYVSVWSLIVAKDSLTRFRIIFFSFTISILLLLLSVIWLLWKFSPLIKQFGWKHLFDFHPFKADRLLAEEAPPSEEAEGSDDKKAPPAGATSEDIAGKGIDET